MYKLTMKDYMIKEAKMMGIEITGKIERVSFNKKKCEYTYKQDGVKKTLKVDEWKVVTDTPKYEASRWGDIRRVGKENALKPHLNGYNSVYLGKGIRGLIHRLILITFIGVDNDPLRNEANHDNFDKNDNSLFNLYWVTRKENMNHYMKGTGCFVDYEKEYVGKIFNSRDGKVKVLEYNHDNYMAKIEFMNTGNQKWTKMLNFIKTRARDNHYIITTPEGENHYTNSLNIFKDIIASPRLCELLNGERSEYKGWAVKRQTNVKVK